MKTAVFGAVTVLLAILSLAVLLTVRDREIRSSELQQAVTLAVRTSLREQILSGTEEPAGQSEKQRQMTEQVQQRILEQIGRRSEICIEVLEADAGMGILSVRVTETWPELNGSTGRLVCVRTAVWDRNR